MDNQHRQIAGYRDFGEAEVAAINMVKAKAADVGALIDQIAQMPGIDPRALAIAKTELQTGFMWAVRAIARPGGF
jgi:molybdate-binding protein